MLRRAALCTRSIMVLVKVFVLLHVENVLAIRVEMERVFLLLEFVVCFYDEVNAEMPSFVFERPRADSGLRRNFVTGTTKNLRCSLLVTFGKREGVSFLRAVDIP